MTIAFDDKEMLRAAIKIATEAHRGQYRRDNVTPYIEHPKKVAELVGPLLEAQAVAWLHDVIEDSDITAWDLLSLGIPVKIVEAVAILTKFKHQPYGTYLAAVKSCPLACLVKIADMRANLADTPTAFQIEKYRIGLEFLEKE